MQNEPNNKSRQVQVHSEIIVNIGKIELNKTDAVINYHNRKLTAEDSNDNHPFANSLLETPDAKFPKEFYTSVDSEEDNKTNADKDFFGGN